MYKIGICGHFGGEKNLLNGQTVKTKIITNVLISKYGVENIRMIDTFNWKKRLYKLFLDCLYSAIKCKNIIIMPAEGGVKVFAPLFISIKKIVRIQLIYVVVGGWLPEFLSNNKWLIAWMKKIDAIIVETQMMKEKLNLLGLENVHIMPNFKELKILDSKEIKVADNKPYKLCTFSRVMREKGIEEAIDVVISINNKYKREVYVLDIYGQIEDTYKEDFNKIMNEVPNYINYCGEVKYDEVVQVLKNYYLLLFPTYYKGEGFPGTLLDAFASGLPSIVTDWKYNTEIIKEGITGRIFKLNDKEQLTEILEEYMANLEEVVRMKRYCIEEAYKYLPDIAIKPLLKCLED